ncbi:helix-turn-helix domain-containing protein [Kitasatospora sp. NPDC047058]|uniref:helix-turn-helix domain-containing protein n=1 Tax=Kitasatospora sp. NPDC047058 TaxID=3155620 RepID=UPI00340FEDE6
MEFCLNSDCSRRDTLTASEQERGLQICIHCMEEMRRDLGALPGLYRRCEEALAAPSFCAQRVSGTRSFGIKLNTAAVDARDISRARLRAWCDLVHEGHGCAPGDRTVEVMARFLSRHVQWLCRHAAAGEAARELAETVRLMRRTIEPIPVRRFRVGPCVEADCCGSLVAVIQEGTRMLPSEVRCDCDPGHSWSASQWRELDRQVSRRQQNGVPWLTAREVAELCQTSMSNVYRLASENSWRRQTKGRRVYYAKVDVLASVG